MNSAHLGKKYDCDICEKSYTNKTTLIAHKKVEHSSVQEMWKCDFEFCDKSFKSRQIMKQHQRDVHTEIRIPCELCPAKFKSKLALDRHLKKIHNEVYKCDHCWRSMSSMEAWQAHMLKRHPMKMPMSSINDYIDAMKKRKNDLKETEEEEDDNEKEKEFEVHVKAEKIDIVENETGMDNTKTGNDNTVVKTEPTDVIDLQDNHSEPKTGLEELIDFDIRYASKVKNTISKQHKRHKFQKKVVPDSVKGATEKVKLVATTREEELDPTLKNLILAAIGALKVSFVIEIEVFKKPFKPLFLTFI